MKSPKVLFLLPVICLFFCGKEETKIQTYQLEKRDMIIEITETGELKATHFKSIMAPSISWQFGDLKIAHIIEDGSQVKQGDTLVIFDPTEVHKKIQDIEAELEIALAEKAKKEAEQEAKINELLSNLRLAEISYEIATIQLEQAKYEAEIKKEEIELQLNQSKLSLNQAKMEIDNQKKIHSEELSQHQLKIDQQKANLNEAHQTLEKLTILAPHSGLVIIGDNFMTRAKWTIGDKPWSGLGIISLPDLSELKAETQINEVDISKIEMGQEVRIRLDAGSNRYFPGEIISIASLATPKKKRSKIKVFPVEILLKETDDKLIPGMTVSCQIIVEKLENQLVIPNQCVFIQNHIKYVMKKNLMGFSKQKIETGQSNKNFIQVIEGLKENDMIAYSPKHVLEEEKQD